MPEINIIHLPNDIRFDIEDIYETLKALSPDVDKESIAETVYSSLRYNRLIIAAIHDDCVIGVASIFIYPTLLHKNGWAAQIEEVSVHENWQKFGIGRTLIKECVRVAKERGCYKVLLTCDKSKVEFYKKCGFKRHEVHMRMNIDGD